MNIHCLNKISPVGLKALDDSYKFVEEINESDAILVRSANMLETSLPTRCLAVARAGAGVNNIPVDNYASNGVVVFNTPGANANAVKELTILALLIASRDIKGSLKWVDDNKADPLINKTMEKAKGAFSGNEISGKTLGIIGLGAIGALVSNAASGLNMHVIAVEPSKATLAKNKDIFPKDIEIVSLDELLERSDYISLHVPLLNATKGMIDATAFSKMKDGVRLINCARDAIVNDDDLEKAIKIGKVKKYVTDFPNAKTANMDGVVAISHLGASTLEAEDNCAFMACKQIKDYLENGNIINSVNYPNLDLGKKEGNRLVVLYNGDKSKEVQNIVSSNANIKKMVSGIKGNFGASLFEIDKPICECKFANLAIRVINIE